jgi:hypothetical protein
MDSGLTLGISASEFRSRIQQRGLRWSFTTFPQLQAGSGLYFKELRGTILTEWKLKIKSKT